MTSTTSATAFAQGWQDWHEARERDLAVPYGWLALAGFHWLPAQPAPVGELPGLLSAADGHAVLTAAAADGYRLVRDGRPAEPVDGQVSADIAEGGSLIWLQLGQLRIELIRRGGRDAVRLRAADTDTLRDFHGVPAFPVDENWVVTGAFHPFSEPGPLTVDTARADLRQQVTAVGTLDLVISGQQYTLVTTAGPGGAPTLSFRDGTSGHESAPWRSVPVRLGDTAPGGQVAATVDFNRATNLPFAFSDYGTCPAPALGNVIAARITAGETAPDRPDRLDK